jgi:tRNA threonylcarbamoyladenosine biosynthesis protein TsaB
MIVLAFDTATAETVVGLAVPGREVAAARHTPAEGERPGHAAQLLPLAAGLLDDAGLTFADVERIGVGVGPGTFTGLRIGVATGRALAQASGATIAAVGTLAALGDAAAAAHDGPVLAVLDARRGEAFAAVRAADGTQGPPVVVRPDGLAALLDPTAGPWLAVGDGAVRFRSELDPAGAETPPDGSALHGVDAGALCRLAAAASPADRDRLVPEYVRAPDAVPRKP